MRKLKGGETKRERDGPKEKQKIIIIINLCGQKAIYNYGKFIDSLLCVQIFLLDYKMVTYNTSHGERAYMCDCLCCWYAFIDY